MVPQSSASADGDGDQHKVAQAAPDSKDTLKTLRMAHVAALKGSRYRVLDEDAYDARAPAVGGVLPALVDDLSEKSGRDLGAGVTRNLQVVAEAATGAVQRWIQLNDEATARIMKREEHWPLTRLWERP